MSRLKHSSTFLFIFILFLLSCTKNDNSTIVLLGTESYVETIIDAIPESLQTVFEQQFGEIPHGYVPPKIEGNFIVAPKQRCYSNIAYWPIDVTEPNMSMHFTNQHNSVVEINLVEATETFTDTVYVIGHDNLFTVYYQETKQIPINGNHAEMKRGIIIKGKMCDEGIKDLYFANIIMEVTGDINGVLAQEGQFFIYKDGDGLAQKN